MTQPTNHFDYSRIPADTLENLHAYVNTGRDPGGFLAAVLSNDLARAVDQADGRNRDALVTLVIYIFNKIPSGATGSPDRFYDWKRAGGLVGMGLTPRDVAAT